VTSRCLSRADQARFSRAGLVADVLPSVFPVFAVLGWLARVPGWYRISTQGDGPASTDFQRPARFGVGDACFRTEVEHVEDELHTAGGSPGKALASAELERQCCTRFHSLSRGRFHRFR
jgi:hypothetical protein